jgi:hypothetical protein
MHTAITMGERLKDMIETYIIRAKRGGAVKLSIEAACGLRVIYNIKNEGHVPSPQIAYRLAKACGANEKEALAIAKQCPTGARKAG